MEKEVEETYVSNKKSLLYSVGLLMVLTVVANVIFQDALESLKQKSASQEKTCHENETALAKQREDLEIALNKHASTSNENEVRQDSFIDMILFFFAFEAFQKPSGLTLFDFAGAEVTNQ